MAVETNLVSDLFNQTRSQQNLVVVLYISKHEEFNSTITDFV